MTTKTSGAPGEILARAFAYPYQPPDFGFVFGAGSEAPLPLKLRRLSHFPAGPETAPLADLEIEAEGGGIRRYGARVPLIAAGSNASFLRLRSKFSEAGLESEFPVLLARAHGLVAAYSAHVSSYGPVPGTLAGEAGAVSLLHVAFVDADALACLNASEALGKNYALALVSGHRLDFGGGLGLDAGLAYISMRGVHAPSGAPLRLTAFRAEGSRLSARSQREILDGLRRHLASRAPLEDFVAEQVGDEAVRLARTAAMAATARNCGISGLRCVAGGMAAPPAELPGAFTPGRSGV